MTTKEAVNHLTAELKKDADFRRTYEANIAMAFVDAFNKANGNKKEFLKYLFYENGLHEIANEAADNFLTLFCK